VLDGLAALADKSLLRQEEGLDGEPRFVMLETVREYALERLAASDELEAMRRRHAEYFVALAEAAALHLRGRERSAWLDRLEVEHDNLRAALGWALGGGDVETGACIAIALAGQDWDGLWSRIGNSAEGWRWLEAVLAQRDALAPSIRAWVLLLTAVYRGMLDGNPFLPQRAALDEALALFRAAGDRSGVAYVRCHQALNAWHNDDSRAKQLLEEALALYQELGDHYHRAAVLHHLSSLARDNGDVVQARALLEQSLALCRRHGYVNEASAVLGGFGDLACKEGDLSQATACYWEALLLVQDEKNDAASLWPLLSLGRLAVVQGDDGRVLAFLQQMVGLFREKGVLSALTMLIPVLGALINAQGDSIQASVILRDGLILQQQFAEQDVLIESLEAFAGVAVRQGRAMRAARLLGAAEALRITVGCPLLPPAFPPYTRDVAAARAQLNDDTFAAAWAAGRALTLEQAIAEALNC
jgi:tetratricopeptide (TPR) repeat protein